MKLAGLEEALEAGHEGAIARSLDAEYWAGWRGHEWLKVEPVHTADLVVLAAEWGHGRREGWVSNVHLGVRVPAAGDGGGTPGFAMVGKTFKGMTDRMLEWQTDRFLELERGRAGGTVHLEPGVVAEVAFDGVQESPTYVAGLSLRFARVKGYRRDKGPGDADTLEALRAIREAE